MRAFTAMLAGICLALAVSPDDMQAQGPYYAPAPQDWAQGGAEYGPDGCYDPPMVWGSAEYLLAFRKSRQVPPLVTGNPPGTALAEAGVLGAPSTTVLFGGGGLDDSPSSGVRGEIGVWLDRDCDLGVGGSFTGFEEDSVSFSRTSDGAVGSEILGRPIYDTLFNQQAAQLVAYTNLVRGTVNVSSENQIYNAEVFVRKQVGFWELQRPFVLGLIGVRSLLVLPGTQAVSIVEQVGPGGVIGGATRCDFIMGYQFSRIEDSLRVSNNLVSLDPAFLGQVGTTLDAFDAFDARNDFHGGTLGLKLISTYGPWSLTMLGKVGLGSMHQAVTIDGRTVITVPGGPSVTTQNGLLAQPSNMGVYGRNHFAVVPEARILLNYHFSRRLSAGVGYNFIYWNNVALAGEQVDTQVDVTQTFPNPTFAFRETDMFVHAVTFQAQLNY